jgi:hypothetical protein
MLNSENNEKRYRSHTGLKAGSKIDVWREVTRIYFEHGPNGALNRPASVQAIAYRDLNKNKNKKNLQVTRIVF